MSELEKDKEVSWDNLAEKLDELNLDGVLDGEESNHQIIATEEEFQELLKGLNQD